jgi:hypothetical protein
MVAGTSTSPHDGRVDNTATASPSPKTLSTRTPPITNEPNTQNMMAAAAVMTRAVWARPSATAVALSPVLSQFSRMRESRNTS